MSTLLRIGIVLGGIALLFVLLAANKYAVQEYWLPAVEDTDDIAGGEGVPADGDASSTDPETPSTDREVGPTTGDDERIGDGGDEQPRD